VPKTKMKSSIKKLKNCKNIVEVKLPLERVRDEFKKVYSSIGKVANIPGYRVGKAPQDLLELHYGKTAKEEVLKNLIPETYRMIIDEYKLNPIGYPDISDVKLDSNQGFSYKATFETRPDIPLKNYKGLKLKKKKVEVKDEDVQKDIESLREANVQEVPKKDSKDNQEKEKVIPELDDEFAKDLGFDNLDTLKDAVRKNLQYRLENESAADLEMQIINQLVDRINFEIPDSLVHSEKERLLKDATNRLSYMEAIQKKHGPEKKFTLTDKDKKELESNSHRQAERQVKAFFILDKIAEVEKIYIKEEELEKRIEGMAAQYRKSKEEMRKYLEDNHLLDEVGVNIRNKKVIGFLLKEAKII